MPYLAIAIVLAAVWLLGTFLYFCLSWRDILLDLSTAGQRGLVLIDLFVALLWPLLLLVEVLLVPIRRFRQARVASRL